MEGWIALGSLIVAAGALAVTALTLVLNYRERTSAFRTRLYDKQAEAHEEILAALRTHHAPLQQMLFEECMKLHFVEPIGEDARIRIRQATAALWNEILNVEGRWALYVPKPTTDALNEYRRVVSAVTAPEITQRNEPTDLVFTRDPGMPVSEAYVSVIAAMRKAAGTEPLSAETLRLFGERDERGKRRGEA